MLTRGIIGILGEYGISDYTAWFDDYSFIKDLSDDKIAAIHWNEVSSFSDEIWRDYNLKLLDDKLTSSMDWSAISTYSVYIEDILKRKGLPMICRSELEGFENLLNPSYENIKTTKKDGKLYYIIMNQKIKIYRFLNGKILVTDTGLKDVVIADLETKKMYSAYYTERDGIIYIYKDYIF